MTTKEKLDQIEDSYNSQIEELKKTLKVMTYKQYDYLVKENSYFNYECAGDCCYSGREYHITNNIIYEVNYSSHRDEETTDTTPIGVIK